MAQSMGTTDRIAHFLRLAEDESATQAERDLAGQQAERLMVKHGIDRATAIAQDSNQDAPREEVKVQTIFFGGSYADARMMLAYSVVTALRLKAYKGRGSGIDAQSSHGAGGRATSGVILYIVGHESDLRETIALINSLDLQAAVAVKAHVKNLKQVFARDYNGQGVMAGSSIYAWTTEQKQAYRFVQATNPEKVMIRRSFIEGFGQGAADRLRSARATVVTEAGSGTALVLRDREQEVSDHYDSLKLGKGRARGARRDFGAMGAGRTAGRSANTGGRAVGTAQRGISI